MRADAPNGGLQDRTIDLRAAGFMSTGALSAKVGAGTLQASYIVNELGVPPRVHGPTGNGYYWAPEQVRQVRQALILKLMRQEFAAEAAA